jgi:hypothetical protein
MQLLDLRPGPLSPRQPPMSGQTSEIEYDERHRALMTGPLLARLSPFEFALVMAVIRRRRHWQQTPGQTTLVVSAQELCTITHSKSEYSVHKHMNGAARKVEALGIRIYRLRSENVYLMLFEQEVTPGSPGDPPGEDQMVVVS